MQKRVFVSLLTNPYLNLALENSILESIDAPALFLYQNAPSVVIGRAQNPWIEADIRFLHANHIPLVRRQSGGGTVVHDIGNLNFSFLSPKAYFDKEANIKSVQHALLTLGLQVDIADRCDLFVKDNKISGSAFRETRQNCFHHGTLLIHSDLDFLKRCLKVPAHKIVSKSIPSRRSSVINLCTLQASLTIEQVKNALIQHFMNTHALSSNQIQIFNTVPAEFDITEMQTLYASEEWIYKRTLPFTEKTQINDTEVKLYVEGGIINNIDPMLDAHSFLLNETYHHYRLK